MTRSAAAASSKGDDQQQHHPASSHPPRLSYPPPDGEEYRSRGVASRLPEPPHDSSSFLQLVDHRVSVREFRRDVSVEDRVLVVIVRQVQQKRALAEAAVGQEWIADAPVVLAFLADEERSAEKYHDRGRYLYAVQDATIAASYTQLALEAAGLASCWVGAFHEDQVADIVGASAANREVVSILRPVVLMPVGMAAEHPKRHRRRAIQDFVHRGYVNATHPAETTEGRKNNRPTSKRAKTSEAGPF